MLKPGSTKNLSDVLTIFVILGLCRRDLQWLSKKRSDCGTFFCYNHHVGAKLKAKTNYAAILFAGHYYDKRHKLTKIFIKSARFAPMPVQNGRFG
jgi:hypothetical protein